MKLPDCGLVVLVVVLEFSTVLGLSVWIVLELLAFLSAEYGNVEDAEL